MQSGNSNSRKWLITAAIAVGAALGAFGIAGAATSSTTSGSTATSPAAGKFQGNENSTHEKSESAQREADEKAGKFGFGGHGHETVVTGATAARIKSAALAAVPGTVTKTEQRSDGSYEAEITKADGSEVHVSLDKNFVVTSTNAGGHFGPGDGGPGGVPGV
jgi:uncharacterized membrane protein YkoI